MYLDFLDDYAYYHSCEKVLVRLGVRSRAEGSSSRTESHLRFKHFILDLYFIGL